MEGSSSCTDPFARRFGQLVEFHRGNIMTKLGASNVTELIAWAGTPGFVNGRNSALRRWTAGWAIARYFSNMLVSTTDPGAPCAYKGPQSGTARPRYKHHCTIPGQKSALPLASIPVIRDRSSLQRFVGRAKGGEALVAALNIRRPGLFMQYHLLMRSLRPLIALLFGCFLAGAALRAELRLVGKVDGVALAIQSVGAGHLYATSDTERRVVPLDAASRSTAISAGRLGS